jgi:asparagine synthase (glutamine-hydrolysing)
VFEPGGYLKVVNNEKIVDTLWYDIDENIKFLDYDNRDVASDTIRSLVERGSVERTVSDVPVCTLLSGGIDSSAITYHVSKEIPDLVSYIAVFDEKSRDLRCAREVAEMLDKDVIEVKVQPPTVNDIEGIIKTIEMKYKAQIEISWGCIKLAERISGDGFKVVHHYPHLIELP